MKNKLVTAIIVSATVILAGIAVFTAIRLYQLKSRPVAPSVPESEPAAIEPEELCDVDVMLVLDISGSMRHEEEGKTKLEWVKEAASAFVNNFINMGETAGPVRIGLVTFGYMPEEEFAKLNSPLTTKENLPQVISEINNIQLRQGVYGTCLECALKETNEHLIPNKTTNKTQYVIMLSDGYGSIKYPGERDTVEGQREKATALANDGRSQGVQYFTIGYGETVKYDEATLKAIANDPDSKYYTYQPNAVNWISTFESLISKVCETNPSPSPSPSPSSTPAIGPSCAPLSFTLGTASPSPTPTPSPSASPSPTPTATPLASCNNSCSQDADCEGNLTCSGGLCRNPSCTIKTNCTCDTPAPATKVTPAPSEPALPQAGIGTPTIVGAGLGILLLLLSLTLAL